jgi:hypothetical protein
MKSVSKGALFLISTRQARVCNARQQLEHGCHGKLRIATVEGSVLFAKANSFLCGLCEICGEKSFNAETPRCRENSSQFYFFAQTYTTRNK